ncbi:DnaD domain-containing protein [Salipaludibacillus aurantiacus]|uniref:DnaD and phage-associated domain-containing protein n=1 Tax=Salipaludibacillus aurantiacus TaxID=1601833 RepID=A0A1H9U1Z0_9BACI|nr:DnaD domain protein [Salipaludibacillus aurantiacus]SES03103.1 DnaD and phage-associated domain-containing protein [Salipaludibacillus aurantiacus]
MKGAFQISREIFENPIWNDIPKFRIFFFIVGNAVFSHEGVRKGGILIKRGQFLRSYRNLRDDLEYIDNRAVKKYSTSVIKRKIDQLVKEERLLIEDTELGTLFTVVNYDLYQGFDNYRNNNLEQRENSVGTAEEQRWNNNKNVKNVKNDLEEEEAPKSPDNPFEVYQQNYGILKPIISQSLAEWCNDLSDELVSAAIKLAVKRNGRTFTFIEAILKEWNQQQITTLNEARIYEESKSHLKKGNFDYGPNNRGRHEQPEREDRIQPIGRYRKRQRA